HLVVFSLRGNTPSMNAIDLVTWIESGPDGSVLTPGRPQDLVNAALDALQFVFRLDDDHVLCVQKYGIGFIVVGGNRSVGGRMNPCGSIPLRHGREQNACQAGRSHQKENLRWSIHAFT